MKTHNTELQRIKDLLRENRRGMKITGIARTLGMNRNAAAKFLEILLMTGQVEVLEHGMSKIFILSRRTGIPTMLDGSSDMILILDAELKISLVNDRYLSCTGMRQEELHGKSADAPGLPVLRSPVVREKIRRARFGEDARTEIREVLAGGEVSVFDIRVTPAVFNDGSRGITVIIADITQERRQQETATDENRRMVEGILSCIDDPVLLLDSRAGTVAFCNPAAQMMFGYESAGKSGNHASIAADVTAAIPCLSRVEDSFRRQGYFETGVQLKERAGREFPADLHLRPVYDSRGSISNIVVLIRDRNQDTGNRKGSRHDAGELQLCQVPLPYPHLPLSKRGSGSGY